MTKLEQAQRICFETFPSLTGGMSPIPNTLLGCLEVAEEYKIRWAGGPYFREACRAAFDIRQLWISESFHLVRIWGPSK